MRTSIILAAIIAILIQSQSRLVCWPLLVLAWVAEDERKPQKYIFAFLLGIFSDLALGRNLGVSSLLFITMILTTEHLALRFKSSLKLNLALVIVFQLVYILLVNFFHI